MALTDVAVRFVGLLYAWWWEEYLPKMISGLSPSKAEWYVSADDMADCFMNVPTKTVVVALLKTNASSEIVRKALEAQKADNREMLIEQLSGICLDEIFGTYKLIDSFRQQCEIISGMAFSEKKAERKTLYTLTDAFEAVKCDSSLETQRFVERISELAHSIELDEENILDNPEPFIFVLCIGIQLINDVASDRLGKFDPIADTLKEIT